MSAEQLAATVRRHGIPAFVFGGALFAIPTDVHADGRVERPVEQLPLSYGAVLRWLGY